MAEAKLKAPKGVTSVSFDGIEYAVSKRGFVNVPPEAIGALVDIGCIAEPEIDQSADEQAAAQ